MGVYSRILIGREPTLNFPYFCGGVSTWQINIVFVMCSRHQRQIRDLFAICFDIFLQLLLKSLNTPADLLSQLRQSIFLILRLYACSTSTILIASVQRS